MRLTPSDPDIQTIINRIKSSEIDLQPEFQRGEIWSKAKKQRLVDSIIRDWHIPPIHVIVDPDTGQQQVLDGQQRLVAIRDFYLGEFPLDGSIEPVDQSILKLDGVYYEMLPVDVKRRFDQFTIRVFRITDFKPSEPGELFYRLNQPTALTAAEQRNAFFGQTRKEVKSLLSLVNDYGLDESFWGFSNARMAYEDVISRAAMILEQNTLKKKITAGTLADKFRSGASFSFGSLDLLERAIVELGECKGYFGGFPRFNKATAQSWLVFLGSLFANKLNLKGPEDLAEFIQGFEHARLFSELGFLSDERDGKFENVLFRIYEDRSTARVADVSSVQLRDFSIWFQYAKNHAIPSAYRNKILMIQSVFGELKHDSPAELERVILSFDWGDVLWQ